VKPENWQSIISASSVNVPFDATPVDFMKALRAESCASEGFTSRPVDPELSKIQAPSVDAVLDLNLTEVRTLLQKRELSCVELTNLALTSLTKTDEQTNAWRYQYGGSGTI